MDEEDGLSEHAPLINHTEEEYNTSSPARYGRAVCLIMELGCQTIRNFIIDKLDIDKHNIEEDFTRIVDSNKLLFKRLKQRILTDSQWGVLFPITGLVKMQSIDLTLWVLIGRNLVTETTIPDWKRKPLDYEIMPGHDFVRIRETRNVLAHLPTPELSYAEFQSLWEEISAALIRLGATQQSIESYKTRDLDSDTTEKCILKVKNQCLEELKHVYLQGTQTKRCIRTAAIVMAIIALSCVISVLVPMFTLMEPKKQCADYKISIPSGVVAMYKIPREGWKAKPPLHNNGVVHIPVPYVIISDTGWVGRCDEIESCCRNMREIQDYDLSKGFNDVLYSYVIGNEGTIFEARGLNQIPASAYGWNHRSISLAFMGTYFRGKPPDAALNAARYFIKYLQDQGTLQPNFTLYGQCQVRSMFPCSPGPEIYEEIKTWRGWKEHNGSNCDTTC